LLFWDSLSKFTDKSKCHYPCLYNPLWYTLHLKSHFHICYELFYCCFEIVCLVSSSKVGTLWSEMHTVEFHKVC
jgi:hypothetical protein